MGKGDNKMCDVWLLSPYYHHLLSPNDG